MADKTHLLGLRTRDFKLGTYAQWNPGTTTIFRQSLETEFYDYQTPGGRAEVSNTPEDPRAAAVLAYFLDTVIPNELEVPLPMKYLEAQTAAKQAYLVRGGR